MAVISEHTDSRITLVLQNGFNESGNPVFKSKTFNRVKPAATDELVFSVATSLASLQTLPLSSIELINTLTLEEE